MILVTGGTGFVGQDVVRELLRRGYRVRLLVRQMEPAVRKTVLPSGIQVEFVEGDALQPESLPRAMVGVSAVINLIGIIAETSDMTFHQAHVEATHNLLAAARQAGVTRWLQMSAIGARARGRSGYQTTKWEAEELVRASGLDWTIFRPSLIYGHDEHDRLINLLRRLLSSPLDRLQLDTFPVLDDGRVHVQPVSVLEVAHCFVAALARPGSIGQTYDLVGPEPVSWLELICTVARSLGKEPLHESFPILAGLRGLLWFAVVALPITVIICVAMHGLGLFAAEIAALVWVFLAIAAWRWRQLLIFSLPSGPLLLAAAAADELAPRPFRFGEQLRMMEEDNVGDPGPAQQMFSYAPESFSAGVRRLVGSKD